MTFNLQVQNCNNPFLGVNTIQALDKYVMCYLIFVKMLLSSHILRKVRLCIHGIPNNIILEKYSKWNVDLTSLQLIYNSIEENITDFLSFPIKIKPNKVNYFIQEIQLSAIKSIDSLIEELGK